MLLILTDEEYAELNKYCYNHKCDVCPFTNYYCSSIYGNNAPSHDQNRVVVLGPTN